MNQDQRYALILSRLEAAKGAVHLAAALADNVRIPTQHEHDAVIHLASSIAADLRHVVKKVDV